MKNIVLLGSTGSIGTQTLDVVRSYKEDLHVVALAAGSSVDGLLAISVLPEADVVLTAIVGMIGIRPTIAAIEAGKDIALANKETLVTAGHIIMPLAKKHGVN